MAKNALPPEVPIVAMPSALARLYLSVNPDGAPYHGSHRTRSDERGARSNPRGSAGADGASQGPARSRAASLRAGARRDRDDPPVSAAGDGASVVRLAASALGPHRLLR